MNLPKRVLLIDDDEEELLILKAALNECCKDVELLQEKNGQAMLAQPGIESPVPDIIFLDWNMPLISGGKMLAGLRELPQYNAVPVVIFTGSIDPAYRDEAQALGASYFIYKPFSINDLANKLTALFSLDWRQFQSAGRLF